MGHSLRCAANMAWDVQRGAHTFFLRMGKVPRWGGYTVNLIHYEDAARLAAAVSTCPLCWLLGDGRTWLQRLSLTSRCHASETNNRVSGGRCCRKCLWM